MSFCKWQEKELAEWTKLNNRELFEEMIDAQQPDDYDGCWTSGGRWRRLILIDLVEGRLKDWLEETNGA